MQIEGIDVAFYHSNDIGESVRWYEEVLGLVKVSDFGDWVEFNVGGARFGLDSGNTAKEIPNAVVSFKVTDLDAALAELESKGVRSVSGVIDIGVTRFAAVLDPSGNVVQFSEPRG